MSRSLMDLHPELKWRAEQVQSQVKTLGIPILIHFTLRSFAEQQALYDQGRTTSGKIVTWALPGESDRKSVV